MMMGRIFLLGILAVTLMPSCKSTRNISEAMVKKDTAIVVVNPTKSDSARLVSEALDRISKNMIEFETFSAKLKVDYQDSRNRKYDFNAFLRMKKDSVVWVSIIAALGIEAFRVIITPDSVRIMDKLNKTVEFRDLAYLQEISQIPFDFRNLQDLIVGNPVYLDSNITSYQQREDAVVLSTMGSFFRHFMTFSKDGFRLLFSKLDDIDPARSRTANLSYEGYEQGTARVFSNVRRITIAEKNTLDVQLAYRQVEFNQPQNYPFQVPKNFKRK